MSASLKICNLSRSLSVKLSLASIAICKLNGKAWTFWTSFNNDVQKVQALPFNLQIAIDANESLTDNERDKLQILSEADILYLEEPFATLDQLMAYDTCHMPLIGPTLRMVPPNKECPLHLKSAIYLVHYPLNFR